MNIVELFCGSGTISNEFEKRGHNVFSIDIRKRKGVCEPTLRKNILQVIRKDIPFKKVDVVWASPPCDVFSKASGNFHWNDDGSPRTEKCIEHIQIMKKCLALIEKISPGYFFIENPDAKMKYQKPMIKFLVRNKGMIKKFNLGDYGFVTHKPTLIFTNAYDFKPGTYSNSTIVDFRHLTKAQRQKTPQHFANELVSFCEKKYNA